MCCVCGMSVLTASCEVARLVSIKHSRGYSRSVRADGGFSNIEDSGGACENPPTDGMWLDSGPTLSSSASHWRSATDYIDSGVGWDRTEPWTAAPDSACGLQIHRVNTISTDHPAIHHEMLVAESYYPRVTSLRQCPSVTR